MDKNLVITNAVENELLSYLGVKTVEAGPTRVVLNMEVTPKVHQYVGIMNGGVSVLLAETAASMGAVAASDLSQVTPVGVEINANHLRAVSKGIITVVATPISHGRTMSVWSIEITNDKGKLVCVSRITIYLQKRHATLPTQ